MTNEKGFLRNKLSCSFKRAPRITNSSTLSLLSSLTLNPQAGGKNHIGLDMNRRGLAGEGRSGIGVRQTWDDRMENPGSRRVLLSH